MRELIGWRRSLWPLALATVFGAGVMIVATPSPGPARAGNFASGTFATAGSAIWRGPRIISGLAEVVDGDSLKVGRHAIRLEGIDAPERAQRCPHAVMGRWACGRSATRHLKQLIAHRAIRCQVVKKDRYGRAIALCRADEIDLNAAMVKDGYAWAFIKYSKRFVDLEHQARTARVGIWQASGAQPAWEFRAKRWAGAETAAPGKCAIKGNITRNGRIYHMPWSGWYARTRIEPERGERWFCTEAEAQAAGWRPSHGS